MGFFGQIANQIRLSFGFDTIVDSMDRKIDKMSQTEELNLKKEQLSNNVYLSKKEYDLKAFEETEKIIDRVLENIKKIFELAQDDIKKHDSGMQETIGYYTGNYSSLNTYIEAMRKSGASTFYIQYRNKLENALQQMGKRYINVVLTRNNQDTGIPAENHEITYLYEVLLLDVAFLSLTSSYTFVQWLEDIKIQAENLKIQNSMQIKQIYNEMRPYQNEQAHINYQLEGIKRSRDTLRYTKEYLEAQKDKKQIKRG